MPVLEDAMITYQSRFTEELYSTGDKRTPSTRILYNSSVGSGVVTIYDVSGEWVDFLRYDFLQPYNFRATEEPFISIPFSFSAYETVPYFLLLAETTIPSGIPGKNLIYTSESRNGIFRNLPNFLPLVSLAFQVKNKDNVKVSRGSLSSNYELEETFKFSLGRRVRF